MAAIAYPTVPQRLWFTVKGPSFDELVTRAKANCDAYFGNRPYNLVIESYDQAQGETYDPATGRVIDFILAFNATVAP